MVKALNVLLLVFIGLIILTVTSSYYKFMVASDYIVESTAPCDPLTESCFIEACEEGSDEECTTTYYKIVYRNAQNVSCDFDNTCDYSCSIDEADCGDIFCNPELDECAQGLVNSDLDL